MTFGQLSSLAVGAGGPDEVELLHSIQEVNSTYCQLYYFIQVGHILVVLGKQGIIS